MQFGIFPVGDVTMNPTTGRTPTEHERIKAMVAIALKAEEVGLDVFATGEHHNPPFVPSSPTTMLGYIAARTERLILSTATTLITTNDPVKIAEDYAMLQHLADGRIDLMLGRGNTGPVYPWFGHDIRALPIVQARLAERALLPAEHLVDGGYTSVAIRDNVARLHQIELLGPIRAKRTRQSRKGNVFPPDAFTIDWDREKVICPQGKESSQWATPPSIAPLTRVKFLQNDCGACPVKAQCTRTDARQLTFYPRELHKLQTRARAEQQTRDWWTRYTRRAGIESTINEFVQGHGMRRSRYRSQDKTHVQHVLTAIAINIERICAQLPPAIAPQLRPPTALQGFLDWQHIPRPRSWRSTD
ncbi:LLM class flavin-dependent oxidoreductase [Planomonospora sp. ID67723]|uniref:LLM class flavin-dependent oxidoreductase n=1 Tax=Planomonospora sp. ID67723 TaxID=2738134 RepID=UPI0018C40F7C|nr:LLM class flavin-dependent oxidoreductase [Planomonospora sp. ID67723]MBG0831563.1 LLM class flavin-dependent oxidoreductase [Planomonospora sp. ID67723]